MIHGTGAGHEQTTGEQWWQFGSAFHTELMKRLDLDPARVEIVPFQWELKSDGVNSLGPNSEDARRAGGLALFRALRRYDKDGHDYYLIGHSHGGSVIYNALLQSVAKKRRFERLKAWCTVGTPFLDYRANPRMHNRLGNTGLTIYATAIGAFVFAAALLYKYAFGGGAFWDGLNKANGVFAGVYLPFILMLLGYGAACLAFLFGAGRLRAGWHSQERKKQVEALYGDRWIGFWHKDDEAISALANVRHVQGQIIPSNFLVPFVSVAPILVTVLGGLYLGNYLLLDQGALSTYTTNFLKDFTAASAALDDSSGGTAKPFTVASIVVPIAIGAGVLAIYIGISSLVVAIVKTLAGWIGIPLARMIDSLVWSSVRQSAWGDDMGKESVHEIGSYPPEFARQFAPLPKSIAQQLSENSEKQAILTLERVRSLLGMTGGATPRADLRSELSEHLKWSELIHTTYFVLPDFIDLIAFGLSRAGLADLRSESWPPANRDRAQHALDAIMPPATKPA